METLAVCHRPDHDIQVRHVDDHDRATHEDERGTQQPLQQGAFHECEVSNNHGHHAAPPVTAAMPVELLAFGTASFHTVGKESRLTSRTEIAAAIRAAVGVDLRLQAAAERISLG